DSRRPRLLAIFDAQAPAGAIPQQLAEPWQILRRGDEAKLPHTRFDERGERIIYHRLVIDGLQLFAGDEGQWIESRPRAAGKNDAFHFREIFRVFFNAQSAPKNDFFL